MDRVFRKFVDSLHGNADISLLRSAVSEISGALDLSAFAYLYASRRPNTEVKLISNYPTAWTSHYIANGYEKIDPVVGRAGQTREPFQWGREQWTLPLHDQQVQLLDTAACFGIRCGFTIPIHDPRSRIAALTFATDDCHATLIGIGRCYNSWPFCFIHARD